MEGERYGCRVRLNTKGGSVVVGGKDMCRMTEGPDGGTQSMVVFDSIKGLTQSKRARNAETSQEVLKAKENRM